MASTIKVDKIAQSSGTPAFTIPTADGAANTFLKTDGSGVLSFSAVTTTALTGSTNTWIPTITGANALTGTANFTYDGNILDVKNSGTASSIKLYCESSNAHYQAIKAAPHSGSSDWTLTLPGAVPTVSGQALTATTAGVASWASTGKVLQVVQGTKTDTASTSTASFTDIGVTVNITPSATNSKVLVHWLLNIGVANGSGMGVKLMRDSTDTLIGDVAGIRPRIISYRDGSSHQYDMWVVAGSYLDSPATTSATTYKMQWMSSNTNTSYINRTVNDRNNATNDGRGASSIVVMEIGA